MPSVSIFTTKAENALFIFLRQLLSEENRHLYDKINVGILSRFKEV